MSESKNSKKKTLAILVLTFLACGGGIFLFLVYQGLGEFKPDDKGGFHYGSSAKNALIPLLNYFSQGDSEAALAKKAMNRMESRQLDISLLDGSKADVSDWMAKGGSAGGGAPSSSGGRGASAARTPIPSMGGGLGGVGGGGGGSQTSGGSSSFGGSGDSGNTKISKGGGAAGGAAGGPGKGTLGVLAGTRAIMKEGIRSGSAMTAKSKWDQGFGAASGGKAGGGQLAYAKGGLVKLDGIAKGDIADLKTLTPGSLDNGMVPPPTEDKSANDPLANKVKGSEGGDAAREAARLAAQNAAQAAGQGAGKGMQPNSRGGAPAGDMPDPDTIKAAVDKFCPSGCDAGGGSTYTDKQISYEKNPDGSYNATYEGTHDGTPYKDTVKIAPGKDGVMTVTPISSCTPQAGGGCTPTEFGTNTPAAPKGG